MRTSSDRAIGAGAILLAAGFNLPYAVLAARFDYPGVLREPPSEVLGAFAAGGPLLVLTWYAFALSAMALVPVGLGLALGGGRAAARPGLAVAAGVLGALAGLTQAMGLLRWVMVVPGLAAAGDEAGFALLHAYAGVAVGEHLGMVLTAAFAGTMAALHGAEGKRRLAALGAVTAAAVALGGFEGVALALGIEGSAFSLAAIGGYLLLTGWLVAAGADLLGAARRVAQPA